MMQSSKIVLRNSVIKMSKKSSNCITLLLLLVCLLLYGQFDGFGRGNSDTVAFYQETSNCVASFSADGKTIFELIAERYFYSVFALLIVFIAHLIRKNAISLCMTFSFSMFIAYEFWNIYLIKKGSYYYEEKLFNIIRETILYDVICSFLIIVLLLIQIITTFHYFFNNAQVDKDV